LQEVARHLLPEGVVKFPGFVPDIESVYAATDLFVFPSHEEPLGSALLSAMAHGLPVVAVARGGVPEVVEDGKNGLLMKELDPGALADVIARLLSNPTEARRSPTRRAKPSRRGFPRIGWWMRPSTFTNVSSPLDEISERSASESSKSQRAEPPVPAGCPAHWVTIYYASFLPSRVPPILAAVSLR